MKKLIIIGFLLLNANLIYSQINAVTESGNEVILYNDGTWAYLNDSININNQIPFNEKDYLKDAKSSFLVKSNKVNIGVWINPKNWNFSKGDDKDVAELKFQKKGEDLYAILIAEKMQIPIESLKEIAIDNAKTVASDVKIIKEEYRIVNGIKVLMMQISGTIQGIKFTYFGYYYSNTNGSIQLITYTGSKIFDDYYNDIELFLNGFVEL